jgi:hypothetical protein
MVVVRTVTLLGSCPIVVKLSILKSIVEPEIEMIKAEATLEDGSTLYVSEAEGEEWRDYSYHWQRNNELIKRWDNAPHHKELSHFPHHVHECEHILPGIEVHLTDILAFIEIELKKR